MREQYENPPLLEAACRFRFQSKEPWDDSIADRLHDRLKDVYPTRQQVSAEEEELEDEIGIEGVIQLRRADESGYLSLAPNILTVRRLRPYPGWEEFRAQFTQALHAHQEVAPSQKLQSAALRYLNYIDLPPEGALLSEFTNIEMGLPATDSELEETVVNGWFQEVNLVYRKANTILDVNAGIVAPTESEPPFFVLDFVCRPLQNQDNVESVLEWLEVAHDKIEKMFEACITEQVRAKFEKEPK